MSIGGKSRIDYSWAIQYGFAITFQRVGDILGLELPDNFLSLEKWWRIDRREQPFGLKSFQVETEYTLTRWSKSYFRKVGNGKISAMEARRAIVDSISSLSDYLGLELFFK